MAHLTNNINSSESFSSPRILVVEDEGLIALDIEVHLNSLGYQITGIAETGLDSIQQALVSRPNLILMDIRLKGEMDGIEAASLITEQFDVPIIFLTAFADPETLERAKQISPFGYVLKPFDLSDLRTSIEIALQKHGLDKIIKQQNTWLNTVLESIGDAVITTNNMGKVTFINRAAEVLTQWNKSDALGKDINLVIPLISSEKRPIENPIMQALRKGRGDTLEDGTLLITKNKEEVPVDDSAVLMLDANRDAHGAVIVFRDVTEREQAKQQLIHTAYYDALTDLPNRSLLIETLQHVIDLNKRYPNCTYALLFIDLDRFKVINDSLGHRVGDQFLKITAQRLQNCLRPTDTVARFGGDEFIILLEQIEDLEFACQIAQRINDELSIPCQLENHDVFSSASIGIVQGQSQYEKAEELIRDADIAMYSAKRNGKGRYSIFDEAMHAQASGRFTLENDLRRAIKEKEFQVFYQPIVSLTNQQIIGVEALIRWRHPTIGLIPPDTFVPIAEEMGLIVKLDQWVLNQACYQVKAWQEQFPQNKKLRVSVNLSSYHFSQTNVVEQVRDALSTTQLPAENLQLEITETALIENPGSVAKVLKELKHLGTRIAIDDFGTGYSSLSYLHRYPIDTLKIDRSFIEDVDRNSDQFKIAQTIIVLAKTLNMVTIAEGIERGEQIIAMKGLSCELAQGYFFHKPLTHEQFTDILRSS